ncbi:HAAS signaling domain-containing protein [Glycomyces sp. NPDC048151]|uniref:HAAS signaling domain-containing protein n=1 Tax=Glycomyces sp. NPDC048151 TaxID=3364002 RepID=UPI0037239E45
MTDTPARRDQVAAYRDTAERHLADLLEEIRLDLVAGLRAHLADVAADLRPGETLERRLGSPEECAAAALGYSTVLESFQHDHATATPPRPVYTA